MTGINVYLAAAVMLRRWSWVAVAAAAVLIVQGPLMLAAGNVQAGQALTPAVIGAAQTTVQKKVRAVSAFGAAAESAVTGSRVRAPLDAAVNGLLQLVLYLHVAVSAAGWLVRSAVKTAVVLLAGMLLLSPGAALQGAAAPVEGAVDAALQPLLNAAAAVMAAGGAIVPIPRAAPVEAPGDQP